MWLVEEVAERLKGRVSAVDNWTADLSAIGFGAPTAPARLVYVSSWKRPTGFYHYDCEIDGATVRAGEGSIEALVAVLMDHLLNVESPPVDT